jgi:hypothetical protein
MRTPTLVLAGILALPALPVQAETPTIAELFGCNLREGKTLADLDPVFANFASAVPKVGSRALSAIGSNVWLPYRGNSEFDFVISNFNMTLAQWGEASLAYDASPEGQAADAMLAAVAECPASGLTIQDELFVSKQALAQDDELFVESYRCKLSEGKTMADVDAALAVWKTGYARAATGATAVYRRVPLMAGEYDLFYVAAYDDVGAYARTTDAVLADTASNGAAQAALGAVHRCTGNLWKVRSIIRPPQP